MIFFQQILSLYYFFNNWENFGICLISSVNLIKIFLTLCKISQNFNFTKLKKQKNKKTKKTKQKNPEQLDPNLLVNTGLSNV